MVILVQFRAYSWLYTWSKVVSGVARVIKLGGQGDYTGGL